MLRRGRRVLARPCLDWSERHEHLAGALGAAIADRLFARGWLLRVPGGRAVRLTAEGAAGLQHELGFVLEEPDPRAESFPATGRLRSAIGREADPAAVHR